MLRHFKTSLRLYNHFSQFSQIFFRVHLIAPHFMFTLEVQGLGLKALILKSIRFQSLLHLSSQTLMACRQKRISRFTISKSLDILLVLGFHVGATPDLGKLRSWQIRSCAVGKSEVVLLANQKLRSWQIKSKFSRRLLLLHFQHSEIHHRCT